MNTYYQPSGKFSVLAFLIFLLTAIIACPILGLLYAYAIWYIPIIYFNFALVLLFGFAVGVVMSYTAIKFGKVRNLTVATVLGLGGGLIAFYFHWAVWLDLVINAGDNIGTSSIGITVSNIKFLQVFALVTHPDIMLQIMGEVYKNGTWGLFGFGVSGIFLAIIWLLEATGILVACVIYPRIMAGEPYDESSDKWMKEVTLSICNFINDPAELVRQVEAGNYSGLQALQFVANAEEHHSVLTLFHADQTDYYLSIENKLAVIDKDGKPALQGNEFMKYLSISKATGDMLLSKTA
jgi:hypothetical protein